MIPNLAKNENIIHLPSIENTIIYTNGKPNEKW